MNYLYYDKWSFILLKQTKEAKQAKEKNMKNFIMNLTNTQKVLILKIGELVTAIARVVIIFYLIAQIMQNKTMLVGELINKESVLLILLFLISWAYNGLTSDKVKKYINQIRYK